MKLAIFDGDGVVWKFNADYSSSWHLARELLDSLDKKRWDLERRIFHKYFDKKNHEEYKRYILKQFELIKDKAIPFNFEIPFVSGFEEFSEYISKNKYSKVLLSGGFWPVIHKASKYFDFIIGNLIKINEGKLNDISVIVTPFSKPNIIKEISKDAEEVLIFADVYEYGIFRDKEILSNRKFKIYLINQEEERRDLNKIIEKEFYDFEDVLNYFKNNKDEY